MWQFIRRLIAKIFGFKDDVEEVCETTIMSEDEREEVKKDAEKDLWNNI